MICYLVSSDISGVLVSIVTGVLVSGVTGVLVSAVTGVLVSGVTGVCPPSQVRAGLERQEAESAERSAEMRTHFEARLAEAEVTAKVSQEWSVQQGAGHMLQAGGGAHGAGRVHAAGRERGSRCR